MFSFHNKNSDSLNLIPKSLVAPRLPLKSCEAESSQPIVDPHMHNTLSTGLCHFCISLILISSSPHKHPPILPTLSIKKSGLVATGPPLPHTQPPPWIHTW